MSTIGLITQALKNKFKHEVKPDVALYSKRSINFLQDELRMSEMPLLAIEILSPAQGQQSLIDKINALFEMGVQSCWLVNPGIQAVTVFSSFGNAETFVAGVIRDVQLDIEISHAELFH